MKRLGWVRPDGKTEERRSEPRFTANMPVMVTVLGTSKQPPIGGRVEDISGSALRFRIPSSIDCGAAIKVEGNDMLLLGEVSRSQLVRDGYQVVVQISHSLASLSDLERLNRSLLGKSPSLELVGSAVGNHAA
jgi:hypothetical protein